MTTILIVGDAPVPPGVDGRVGRFHVWDDDAMAWFDAELAAALVGWHGTLIGPEQVVRDARARAVTAGAVADELTVVITDAGTRRVYCPACGTVTSTSFGVAECNGCGADMVVGQHFSPVQAAYLGALC